MWSGQVEKFLLTLNFVRRNFSTCPLHIREHCYTTLVRPQLEYASSVYGTITYSAILINLNLFRGVQPVLCVMATDRHSASHPCCRDSLGTLYNSGVLATESGCFRPTAYAMVWLQYHLITSSRPQLLPEDTKPATCKSDATPVCTASCSFQAQSDYGTE